MEVPGVRDLWDMYAPLIVTAVVLTVGFIVVGLFFRLLRRLGNGAPRLVLLAQYGHRPAQVLVALLTARFAVLATTTTETGMWRAPLLHGMLVATIAAGGWLLASLVRTAVETTRTHFQLDGAEQAQYRRANTQLIVLQRVAVAAITVLTIGAVLYTFPAVRGIGTGLLASAGVVGVVGGLAAQSTLGNLIAGMQLAFGDRLRIDDVVVVEGEWGRVEEITLGYVVVRIWDQRRLILPTSYFTATPFTSWSRRGTEILGTVELDLDWTVPVPETRAELERYVDGHPLWDRRKVSLQVTEATGSLVKVRAVVSAADGSRAWDLRCDVREHLVEWVRRDYPHALPRTRAELLGVPAAADQSADQRADQPADQPGVPSQHLRTSDETAGTEP
jgi:small-conductance mechanosensitive channel